MAIAAGAARVFDDALAGADIPARARELNEALAGRAATEIIATAIAVFPGRVGLVSSFGAESAALLHLVASVDPSMPVIFLDTGKHFAQTLAYRDELARRFRLRNVRNIAPAADEIALEDMKGELWRLDNDACCALRKVRPLTRALAGFDAWVTGRKRFHGGLRSYLPVVEAAGHRIKFNPLARWSEEDLARYVARHDLPQHPLVKEGFASIGCWPCTAPVSANDDPRAGRWRGLDKTECGIHRAQSRVTIAN